MGGRSAAAFALGSWVVQFGRTAMCAALLACSACEAAQGGAPARPVVSSVAPLPDWRAGQRYFYTSKLISQMSVSGGSMIAFSMTAELSLDARPAGEATEFVVLISKAQFKAENPGSQPQFDQLANELSQPFGFATLGGRLSALEFPPTWSPFATSIARTLAAAFQFVERPAEQAGPSWTAREVDATGNFDLEYTPGEGKTLATKKLGYASIALGKISITKFDATVTPKVLASTGSVTLGASPTEPRLRTVSYQEKLRAQLTPTSQVDSETQLKLDFARSETPAKPLDWAASLAGARKLAPDEVAVTPTPSTKYDATRIGDYTVPKAIAELEAEARDPHGNELIESVRGKAFEPEQLKERENQLQANARAFAALAALARSDAKNVPPVVARIRAHSVARRALSDALSSAGTPEAQAALVALLSDSKLELPARRTAAFSLIRTESATSASVSALESHVQPSDPLSTFALLGLGTISRRLREAGEIARADAIVLGLVHDLSAATAVEDQMNGLRGIANSGASSAFEAVKPFLDSKEPRVESAAVDAIRLMARPEIDPLIAAELAQPNVAVQDAALAAISVREPSPVLTDALSQAAKSASRSGLRIKAIAIIGRWLPRHPELRPKLELIAQSDSADQIRAAAKQALGG